MESPPSLSHHKNIKWRGRPLSSMVFHNPWFFPKVHCNNVIKRLYAFSIKHWRIFDILHFSHSIELLGYWFWVPFPSVVWEVRLKEPSLSLTPPCDLFTLCYSMHQMITICRFTPLLSRHPSLSSLSPQDQSRYALHGNEGLSIVRVQRFAEISSLLLAHLKSIAGPYTVSITVGPQEILDI